MESSAPTSPVKKTQQGNALKSFPPNAPGQQIGPGTGHHENDPSEVAVESKEKGDDIGSYKNHKAVSSNVSHKVGKAKSYPATVDAAANNYHEGFDSDYREPSISKNDKAVNSNKSMHVKNVKGGAVNGNYNSKTVNYGHEKVSGGYTVHADLDVITIVCAVY